MTDCLNGPLCGVLIRQPEGCLNRRSTKSTLMEDGKPLVLVGWFGEIASHYQDPHVLQVIL